MEITSLNQLDLVNGIYSYADYLVWKIKERVELLKGKILEMSAPSPIHQEISGNLQGALFVFLKNSKCKLYTAPFDVRFPQKGESQVYTVVQPDLCVVCDFEKIDSKGCVGAPDLVVEILSPGNSKKEMKSKFALYQEEGVCEYWVVDPERELVFVYVAENKKFKPTIPIADDYVYSTIFPDFKIHTSDLFHIKN
ncbi:MULTISPECIES: Uma2 family endonuclease [Capnocytophaga]|uniref:Uma2 family endonuclease n=1 Tax=Capnocytophaga TaxID=1016 RepID=UPI00027C48EC|nr:MULTISPECIES: Uma2 family endonuclease [Capnocytophaga]EJU26331.1 putative restriction endonuclease [Capnocytophaga sp. CM59]